MCKVAFVIFLATIAAYGLLVEAVDPLTRGAGNNLFALFLCFWPKGLLNKPLIIIRKHHVLKHLLHSLKEGTVG